MPKKSLTIEETDSFSIYPLWRKIISSIAAIVVIILFWLLAIATAISGLGLLSRGIQFIIPALFFMFFAILVTIAGKNSIYENLYSIIIGKDSLTVIPGKLLGTRIGRKKIFDYISFDYYLYYNTDDSGKIFYIRFLIKDKKGKICFKLRSGANKLDKMFEQLKLNNKDLKEIQVGI